MPSKEIIIVIQFMFLYIKIFWALLRAHFNPCLTVWAKMSLIRAQNVFMPSNINSIIFIVLLTHTNINIFLFFFLGGSDFAKQKIILFLDLE